MPLSPSPTEVYKAITFRRAAILSLLVEEAPVAEIGDRLRIEPNTVRSHVRILRELTGCHSMHALREFWQQHRVPWLAFMAEQAGVEVHVEESPSVQQITLEGHETDWRREADWRELQKREETRMRNPRMPIGIRPPAVVAIVGSLALSLLAFGIGRQVAQTSDARAADPAQAPQTLNLPPDQVPPIDTRDPDWELPYWAEWAAEPRADQVVNGILIGPTVERDGWVCAGSVAWEVAKPEVHAGTKLEITPDYLPPGGHISDAELDDYGSLLCDGKPGSSALTVGIGAAPDAGERVASGESWFIVPHGGVVNVHKRLFVEGANPSEVTGIPASHWHAATIGGLPAVVGRPVIDAGLGGGAVVVWDEQSHVLTTVYSFDLALSELLKFAEGVVK